MLKKNKIFFFLNVNLNLINNFFEGILKEIQKFQLKILLQIRFLLQ
jgi:hypothetical protein